ncbi:MAG: hypothetical protein J2P26_00700 [Nocardiopsaceae bacterium]|nr:hypothetical protein [Nocardiopsaceae bacterium]
MTPRTTATPTHRLRIAGLARDAGRKLSDRLHAAADDHARAQGWEVTETRGWLGLRGRTYRDPRFAARRRDLAAGRSVRHD